MVAFCPPHQKRAHIETIWASPHKTVWTKVASRPFDAPLAEALQVLREQVALAEAQREIEALKNRVAALEQRHAPTTSVIVETLAPSDVIVSRPFHVLLSLDEDGYRAALVDANLMAFGDSEAEAIWNLKDLISLTFERLCELPREKLGPGPAKQLAVLETFLAPMA